MLFQCSVNLTLPSIVSTYTQLLMGYNSGRIFVFLEQWFSDQGAGPPIFGSCVQNH